MSRVRTISLISMLFAGGLCACECQPPAGEDAGSGADAGVDGGGGGDAGQQTTTTVCEGAPTSSAAAGDCEVQAGDGAKLIVGTLLTPGEVFEGGGLLLDSSGAITCVGCDCAAQAGGATQILCNQVVVSPGLINSHDHIGWMGDYPRAAVGPSLRYEHRHDWRKGDPADDEPKLVASGGSSNDDKAWGELRFALGGATSINGSGTAPGLLRNLDRSSGLEGLDVEEVFYSTFPLGDSNGTLISSGCSYPSFDSDGEVDSANAYTPHIAEGINEFALNEFICLSSDEGGGHALVGANTAVIHGIGLRPIDVAQMAGVGAKLIWSPRSNICLYGETAPVTLYHSLGVPIALGTDWIPSGSMNMLRELACADMLNQEYYGGYFNPEQLWRMVTIDAARALGVDSRLGLLAAGLTGDVALFNDHAADPYDSVVKAEVDDVVLVLRGGEVLVGHAALVEGLESGCDVLDVCGTSQRVCTQREVGMSLSALESAGGQDYGLFFCGEPDGEPTCVPYRDEQESVMGSGVYTSPPGPGDADGDGVADASDSCPAIFNPARPLDNGQQGDFDGDGVGDVCDPCPLDADSTSCSRVDPDDLDRDGTPDTLDNCPGLANDQSDADSDGKGDDCDPCPDLANPGLQGCPATVYELQDTSAAGHPDTGTRVSVQCTVTAVGDKGFWCQDEASGLYSGIYVYTSDAPMVDARPVAISDGLRVDATYDEYYDLTELVSPQLTFMQAGTVPAPILVAAADIATGGAQAESYEGVLVRVEGVVVTDVNPDDPDDFDVFEVSGGLQVADTAYDELDNTYPLGNAFDSITGVLHYSFGNFKLAPRSDADLALGPPELRGFSAQLSFQRVGSGAASTLPPLFVEMTRAVSADTTITLSSASSTTADVAPSVTISAGADRAEVLVQGVAASATPVQLTAALDASQVHTQVRVLEPTAPAALLGLEPAVTTVVGGTVMPFTLTLDLPAPQGGAVVSLSATPTSGSDFGAVPASVTIPVDMLSASFDFTADDATSSGTITADLGGSSKQAQVTVVSRDDFNQDLSGYELVQANSSRTFALPAGIEIGLGEYVIVARDATQAEFEGFWGVTLDASVSYINSAGEMPLINGEETFTLQTPGGADVVDGPSVALTEGNCFGRAVPVLSAELAEAWQVAAAPGAGTPGGGQTPGASPTGVYISEFCDAPGSGNFNFEFVELYFDGMP